MAGTVGDNAGGVRRPGLDPRTVSRQLLFEKAGYRRPAVSIVLSAEASHDATGEALTSLTGKAVPSVQIITIAVPPDGAFVGSGKQRAFASRQIFGPAISIVPKPDEALLPLINRAVSAATGDVIVLFPRLAGGLGEALSAVVDRFRNEPYLGVADFEEDKRSPSARSTGDRAVLFEPPIAVRGDLWTALGGLEEEYDSLTWALRDLYMRARAIGYSAPTSVRRRGREPRADRGIADQRLFRRRKLTAPDRSALRSAPSDPMDASSRLVIYTSITNAYDWLKPQPGKLSRDSEPTAFLDEATAAAHRGRARGWRVVEAALPDVDPPRQSRFYKANAHLALPESRFSLWIDASISVVFPFPVERLIELFLAECDLCVFRHHARKSIYEEAEACKARGLDRPDVIDAQIDRYRKEGLPRTAGLAEVPVILRRHTKSIQAFNEAWWSEIRDGSWRDQLSFNYVSWKLGVRFATFPLSLITRNGMFLKFRR